MVDLALERMSTDVSGQARRAEMEQTRLEARKLARKLHKRSFFDYIPIEILYSVFTLLAMSNPLEAIKQRAVCRRWRDVLNNIPSLWNSLVLRPKTPQKKIEIWLNRSGGALKSLSIRDGFVFEARPQIQQRHFGNDFWEKLEELEIECGEHMESLQEVLPRGTLSHLRLQKLSITTADGPRPRAMSGHSRSFWGLLEHSCSQPQSLQTLIFNSPVTFHGSMSRHALIFGRWQLSAVTSLRPFSSPSCPKTHRWKSWTFPTSRNQLLHCPRRNITSNYRTYPHAGFRVWRRTSIFIFRGFGLQTLRCYLLTECTETPSSSLRCAIFRCPIFKNSDFPRQEWITPRSCSAS